MPRSRTLASLILHAAAIVALLALGVHAVAGVGSAQLFDVWLYESLEGLAAVAAVVAALRRRVDRGAWLWIAAGLALWFAGDVYYDHVLALRDRMPFPSVSDALYVGFYVTTYVAMVLMVRARVAHFFASLWLDGVIAALTVAAGGAAIILPAALGALDGSTAAIAWSLAYPLADLLLVVVVVAMCALTGWRPGPAWTLLGAGLLVSALADMVNVFEAAGGAPVVQSVVSEMWPLGTLLIARAVWADDAPRVTVHLEGWRSFVGPSVFGVGSLAVLVAGVAGHGTGVASGLAALALLAIMARANLALHEKAVLLGAVRDQAVADALTGLGNRRRLLVELGEAVASGEPRVLLMFDLDGFKGYNDAFGHPAGDALLVRLAERLAQAAAPHGAAYRLGGDEFCVLAPGGPDVLHVLIDRTRVALSESGEGFVVTTSLGAVLLPEEAGTPTDALRLVDERLYRQKHVKHRERGRHGPVDLVLEALYAMEPDLRDHLSRVAAIATRVGLGMGLGPADLARLQRAAELHDIGKIALPQPITDGTGPLGDTEWRMVREHPAVGERLLMVTPELREVAAIVRATHERWDGAGYPDGVAAEHIPLGARIVAVCNAYDAMTDGRPHQSPVTHAQAMAELRRCAGTQFDPSVVRAFDEVAGPGGEGLEAAPDAPAVTGT